ncbi:WH2 motif domain contaning protein [Entamoeba marina]
MSLPQLLDSLNIDNDQTINGKTLKILIIKFYQLILTQITTTKTELEKTDASLTNSLKTVIKEITLLKQTPQQTLPQAKTQLQTNQAKSYQKPVQQVNQSQPRSFQKPAQVNQSQTRSFQKPTQQVNSLNRQPAPPPPPPSAPPPPASVPTTSAPMPTAGRGDLLSQIQRGKKLKKTVTVDKSQPTVGKSNQQSSQPSKPVNPLMAEMQLRGKLKPQRGGVGRNRGPY